ncbi:hypothetical protein [Conchiformibius steedae]|nr:hypothetical protein [Conchiformibius steedae]
MEQTITFAISVYTLIGIVLILGIVIGITLGVAVSHRKQIAKTLNERL